MTLYKLAMRNISHNLRLYILYFYPMVFSIVIYFTFVSLQYNEQINQSSFTLDKIEPAFYVASILLLLFSASFIWYSNAFFTKKRKQEIGLYSLLGMKKKQVSALFFYENLLIGIVALIAGIGLGLLLSKLFTMVLMKLMGFTIISNFSVSSKAVLQTTFVFLVIIMITSIHNYRLIYRYTLIELFKADKQKERIPDSSITSALLSAVLLVIGYVSFLQIKGTNSLVASILFIILGTYLFIRNSFPWLLKRLASIKKVYWRASNLIGINHILFRIKGNVMLLTMIAILCTITLFAMSTTFSLYSNLQTVVKDNYPHSFTYTINDEQNADEIQRLIEGNGLDKLHYSVTIDYLQVFGDLSAVNRQIDNSITLISETDYMKLANRMGKLPVEFSEDEAVFFYDGGLNRNSDHYTGKEILLANEFPLTIATYESYSLLNQYYFSLPVIVKDSLFEKLQNENNTMQLEIYSIENEKSSGELTAQIQSLITPQMNEYDFVPFSSFYEQYHQILETNGLLIFISGFLGLVFLLATGSMIHYKLLTEATADQQRYHILRKIGMNSSQIYRSIKHQVLPIFLLPLLIAIGNSSIFMSALAEFLQLEMVKPYFLTIGMYIILYFSYYFITISKYYSTVTK